MSSWKPNLFYNKGKTFNYNEDYLNECIKYGNEQDKNSLPVIFSLKHLSEITSTSYNFLNQIINREISPYKDFLIKKKSGGYRKIVIPHNELLNVLRFIHQKILLKLEYHHASKAYLKGSSILNNASIHCGSSWFIKIDIRRFFESISEKQIYYCFKKSGYSPRFSFEMARLTTIVTPQSKQYHSTRWKKDNALIGYLPQGYPTSPLLANKVCYELDGKLTEISRKCNCIYTRYSDDIVFSANKCDRSKAKELIKEASKVISYYGFKRNHKKTSIIPPGARKIVTGLVVNHSEVNIKRELKDKIRAHLFYASKYGIAEHCKKVGFHSIVGFKNHLNGLINYVNSIDGKLGDKYLTVFNKINWF